MGWEVVKAAVASLSDLTEHPLATAGRKGLSKPETTPSSVTRSRLGSQNPQQSLLRPRASKPWGVPPSVRCPGPCGDPESRTRKLAGAAQLAHPVAPAQSHLLSAPDS